MRFYESIVGGEEISLNMKFFLLDEKEFNEWRIFQRQIKMQTAELKEIVERGMKKN
jgi:hypothetical protein